jgi:hypothetical protein
MLDPAIELEAAIASSSPDVRTSTRAVRKGALTIAAVCFAGTVLLFLALHRLFYWLPIMGVLHLGVAVFYSSRDEARNRIKGMTDLSRFE